MHQSVYFPEDEKSSELVCLFDTGDESGIQFDPGPVRDLSLKDLRIMGR